MQTAIHNNYQSNSPAVEVIADGFTRKLKALLKYARKQRQAVTHSPVNMTEATLRDIGVSRHQLNQVSHQARFNEPLANLHAQSSMYYPR